MYFLRETFQGGSLFVNMLGNLLTMKLLKDENCFMKRKRNMGATCITSTSKTKRCGE